MRIATNVNALTAWRSLRAVNQRQETSMARLASGMRVNSAADDASGLAISERMRSQIRGTTQAMRNIQDGISLMQTSDGALQEVTAYLQRARELAVQSSNTGVLKPEDQQDLQAEITQILSGIDKLVDNTTFNGKKLFIANDPRQTQVVDSLRRSWLSNAEQLVQSYYGLNADDVQLKIVLDPSLAAGVVALVQGTAGAGGKFDKLELHLNLGAFGTATLPDGGTGPLFDDRVIAHEMVHAVMMRTMNFASLPTWFAEGTAEFIHGANERVAADLAAAGSANGLLGAAWDSAWSGTSADYSAGYVAVRYLDAKATTGYGGDTGIKSVLHALKDGLSLDQAIATTTGGAYTTQAAFVADVKTVAGGEAFLNGLTLNNPNDVGAVGTAAGVTRTASAATAVPDGNTDTWNPLLHFHEAWPVVNPDPATPDLLQIGPSVGMQVDLQTLRISTIDLGVAELDLVNKPMDAIGLVDAAIAKVTATTAQIGAVQNRLEHAYNVSAIVAENLTASESKIRDADMAMEMTTFAKTKILVQSATAMLVQANFRYRSYIQTLLG